MPNWCNNNLTVTSDDPEKIKRFNLALQSEGLFSAFLPNPTGAWDYAWSIENWGVKWDFGRDHHAGDPAAEVQTKNGKKYVQLSFSTAWAPPNGFYNFIHEQLGFRVKAYFYEPGMGFVGSSKNGIENTINIREMTEEWLADNVPAKICNIFNLFEQAAQMEADEKEFNQREKTDTQS